MVNVTLPLHSILNDIMSNPWLVGDMGLLRIECFDTVPLTKHCCTKGDDHVKVLAMGMCLACGLAYFPCER